MIGDKNKKIKGVTLIEILVALSIFSIVTTGAVSLFSSLIKTQKNLLDKAYVLNTLSYSIEYTSKALRMVQKDMVGTCIGVGKNFVLTGASNIKFLNSKNECQEIFLESGALKVRKRGIAQSLTPSNVIVENVIFVLSGEGQEDNLQSRVSFSLKAKSVNKAVSPFLIQTTISQRMLDVFY